MGSLSNKAQTLDGTNIKTTKNLDGLGSVSGAVTLTLKGNTKVGYDEEGNHVDVDGGGNVYGGGDASAVDNSTTVNISGNTEIYGDVFGGGNSGEVSGSATVNIEE